MTVEFRDDEKGGVVWIVWESLNAGKFQVKHHGVFEGDLEACKKWCDGINWDKYNKADQGRQQSQSQ